MPAKKQKQFAKEWWSAIYQATQYEKWAHAFPEYRESAFFKGKPFYEFFKAMFKRGKSAPPIRVLNYDFSAINDRQFKRALNLKNPGKYDDKKPSLPMLPPKLQMEIDCKKNIEDIQAELAQIINLLRDEYGISQNRPEGDPDIEFKILILRRLEFGEAKIRDCLMREYKHTDPDRRDAYRKKIVRALRSTS